jgi:cellulose biosynthesis protein BcsQ
VYDGPAGRAKEGLSKRNNKSKKNVEKDINFFIINLPFSLNFICYLVVSLAQQYVFVITYFEQNDPKRLGFSALYSWHLINSFT